MARRLLLFSIRLSAGVLMRAGIRFSSASMANSPIGVGDDVGVRRTRFTYVCRLPNTALRIHRSFERSRCSVRSVLAPMARHIIATNLLPKPKIPELLLHSGILVVVGWKDCHALPWSLRCHGHRSRPSGSEETAGRELVSSSHGVDVRW
jgi:hypothetical protein